MPGFSLNIVGAELYIDAFHGLQQHTVLRMEFPIDQQESILVGYNELTRTDDDRKLMTSNWETAYRRYFNVTTNNGAFYSLGFRYGLLKMSEEVIMNRIDCLCRIMI